MDGLHIGPCRRAPRDTPKRHPQERSTKMSPKIDFGGAFGGQGSRQGDQRGPEGSQKGANEPRLASFCFALGGPAGQNSPKTSTKSLPDLPIPRLLMILGPLWMDVCMIFIAFQSMFDIMFETVFCSNQHALSPVTSMLCPRSPACSVPSHQHALSPVTC